MVRKLLTKIFKIKTLEAFKVKCVLIPRYANKREDKE
jgi:hypothetical protein